MGEYGVGQAKKRKTEIKTKNHIESSQVNPKIPNIRKIQPNIQKKCTKHFIKSYKEW